MTIIYRLRQVLQNNGAKGLLKFLGSRLVRTQSHLVFVCHSTAMPPLPEWRPNEKILEAHDATDIEAVLEKHDLPAGLDEYLEAVRNQSASGLFVVADGQLVHWAFIMKQSRTLCYLGFDCQQNVLLGSDFTIPSARGRGFQTRSVAQRLHSAVRQGFDTMVSETAPDNVFSARALSSGGMQNQGRIRLWIICNRLVIRLQQPPD